MKNDNRYYIRILAPVHIGCDEVYEPSGFTIDENAGTLTVFDPIDFLRSLDARERTRYADICGRGTIESIIELYKFMRGKSFRGHTVEACSGLIAQYRKTLAISSNDRKKIQQELNNFSISRTAFDPTTQRPCIPGSAVKGALRTAYLNRMAKEKRVQYDRRDRKAADTLEKGLLIYQRIENDPFRLLKVSDFHPVGPCGTRIVYAVNEKKTPSRFAARGPYQTLEIVEPGGLFTGTMRVLDPPGRGVIEEPLSEEAVFKSAAAFYGSERERENGELTRAGIPPLVPGSDGTAAWLRIGRHSGAESLTIAGHRNIRIMKKRGERPGYAAGATTFWLSADSPSGYQKKDLKPFGWATIGQITEDLEKSFEAMRLDEEKATIPAVKEMPPAAASTEPPEGKKTEITLEVWTDAYLGYNAGGGGVLTVTGTDGRKAELRGMERVMAAVHESLHGKLFGAKKSLPKARVTVAKTGKKYEIACVEP